MAKELSEETKKRLHKEVVTDMTMVCLQHGVKIEDTPPSMVKMFIALYMAGMAYGVKQSMLVMNEPITPEELDDIEF